MRSKDIDNSRLANDHSYLEEVKQGIPESCFYSPAHFSVIDFDENGNAIYYLDAVQLGEFKREHKRSVTRINMAHLHMTIKFMGISAKPREYIMNVYDGDYEKAYTDIMRKTGQKGGSIYERDF